MVNLRIKSDLFVSSIIRRCFSDGSSAVVEKKGDASAGAIYFRVLFRDRTQSLYAPAPQSYILEDNPSGERYFEKRMDCAAEQEVSARLNRELEFDSDIWIIELETQCPENYFNIVD